MHVLSMKPLRDFMTKHGDAATPLKTWWKLANHGSFQNFAELKQTFGSVDIVPVKKRDFYVFDIGGNKYRLIATIHFNTQRLFVRYVLTHKEYDAGGWKK